MKILGTRLLALTTLLALLWPGAVRATGASEIPGVPLTASSVSGTVGGETVDLVYAVTLPAGSVLVASLLVVAWIFKTGYRIKA